MVPGLKAEYCYRDRRNDMIDVFNKRCAQPECKRRPSFNVVGQKAMYCAQHRLDTKVDVVSRHCAYNGCVTQPTYYVEGKIAKYCSKHKKDGMVHVVSKRCAHPGCVTQSTCNVEGEIAKYCSKHKEDSMPGMVDVNNKKCAHCKITYVNQLRNGGHCLQYFIYLFPDKPVTPNYEIKEHATISFVLDHFPDATWIEDKRVSGGCSYRHPDLLLHLGYEVIIMEVDENQYDSYNASCENKRMKELFQDTIVC